MLVYPFVVVVVVVLISFEYYNVYALYDLMHGFVNTEFILIS